MIEDPVPEDNTSYVNLPYTQTFNGYSPSGNATGEVVYVNYGTFQDYEVSHATSTARALCV
jgi:N-acetylated-alpha-linked acidic dipeptidase